MEPLKHECGVAMIRLLKPLEYYQEKYGTWMYGLNKLYLLMEEHHIAYTDMKDLLQKQEILDLFRLRIDTLQQEFAHYEQIKRFTLLPEPFSMEKGELTNTLKIKRPVLMKNYAKEIEKMYEE